MPGQEIWVCCMVREPILALPLLLKDREEKVIAWLVLEKLGYIGKSRETNGEGPIVRSLHT